MPSDLPSGIEETCDRVWASHGKEMEVSVLCTSASEGEVRNIRSSVIIARDSAVFIVHVYVFAITRLSHSFFVLHTTFLPKILYCIQIVYI